MSKVKTSQKLNILITGAGAPGISGTIYSLKKNFDNREIIIIGTDAKKNVVGKFLCDRFYVIPPVKNVKNYLKTLIKICKEENVNVLIPQNTMELSILSSNQNKFNKVGTKVLLASKKSIDLANDKFLLMQTCKNLGVPVGKFFKVNNFGDLIAKAKQLGWPDENIVVKPPVSNGMRGVRIISESFDKKKLFYDEKPNSLFTNMDDLKNILGESFPELIVTEHLPGDEYTVDVFRHNNKTTVIPRIRNHVRSGITFQGEVIKHEKLIGYCKMISESLNLENCFGFQFKLDKNKVPKILECNPRVQGTMVLATFAEANIIYASIKKALDEKIPTFEIKWGTKIFRYWGGVGVLSDSEIIKL